MLTALLYLTVIPAAFTVAALLADKPWKNQ